ncbi:ras-related protein Rab-44 [Melospiza georgiana]|uniref:ras-related protein Rab-44 n=1 Tax=Melospiza georgiana TaxID=44398 RepID=UPI0025AC404D|nr:ras-related protein Rab-44 [Melospiza georgiana]
MDEEQPGRTLGVQALGTELQERADPTSGLPGKLETELGEHLEPQPPSHQGGAAHGDGVPEVAPGPGVLDEEHARTEAQPQGETTDSKGLEVLPAPAERAGSEEEEGSGVRQGAGADEDMQAQEEAESLGTTEEQSSGANVQLMAEGDELRVSPGRSTGADLQLMGVEHGEGADEDMQAQEEAESLDTAEEQSSGANVQLIAEGDELRVSPGGSTEGNLQLMAGSSGTVQGGSVHSDVQPLDQEDKEEVLEREAEDAQEEMVFHEGPSPEGPQGGEGDRAAQLEEEKEDGAQGQGEDELPHKPELDLQGSGVRQGGGADEDMQAQEEAENLDTTEEQSSGANVQLMAEGDELRVSPGGSTGADLQLVGEAGSSGTEQGETLDSEVQALDQGDKAELVEGPAEDAQADLQLSESLSSGVPWGGEIEENVQIQQKDDEAQGQGEDKLPHEPELDLHGSGVRQGGEADEDMQAQEKPESLDTVKDQSIGANVQLIAEGDELKSASGESTEADLQLLIQTDSMGTEQGGNVAPDVHPLDQEDKAEVVEREMQELVPDLSGVTIRQRRGTDAGVQPVEEAESLGTVEDQSSGANVQLMAEGDELRGSGVRQGGEADEDMQAQEEAGSLGTAEEQSSGANVQLMAEGDELRVSPGGSTGADLQLMGVEDGEGADEDMQAQVEAESLGTVEDQSSGANVQLMAEGDELRGCPRAALDPEHLYNVLFVGDSHVGKTSFLYRLHADTFNPHLTATVGLDYQIKNLVVDNKRFALRLWDSAGQERYRSMTKQFFRKADGVVLMYDITSEYSFSDVRYWLSCIQEGAEDGVAVLLLGNKTDCAAQRQVPTKEGESLAKEHQLMFYECSAASGHNVFESMVSFTRLLKDREDELKNKTEEVPKAPQKKKSCCW